MMPSRTMVGTVVAFAAGAGLPGISLGLMAFGMTGNPISFLLLLPLVLASVFAVTAGFALVTGTHEGWRRLPARRATLIAGGLGVAATVLIGVSMEATSDLRAWLINVGWRTAVHLIWFLLGAVLGAVARALAR